MRSSAMRRKTGLAGQASSLVCTPFSTSTGVRTSFSAAGGGDGADGQAVARDFVGDVILRKLDLVDDGVDELAAISARRLGSGSAFHAA